MTGWLVHSVGVCRTNPWCTLFNSHNHSGWLASKKEKVSFVITALLGLSHFYCLFCFVFRFFLLFLAILSFSFSVVPFLWAKVVRVCCRSKMSVGRRRCCWLLLFGEIISCSNNLEQLLWNVSMGTHHTEGGERNERNERTMTTTLARFDCLPCLASWSISKNVQF